MEMEQLIANGKRSNENQTGGTAWKCIDSDCFLPHTSLQQVQIITSITTGNENLGPLNKRN